MAKKQDLIGYCGLYCGDCSGYTQTVANLARDLRKELRRYRYDKMAEMFLETNHGVAHLKNLRKLKRQGPAEFVKGKRHWYAPK